MTSHYTWRSVTTLHNFGGALGQPLGHFLLGSHNLMVTALGSCVKWPLVYKMNQRQQGQSGTGPSGPESWFEWLDDEAQPSRLRAYNCLKGALSLTDRPWQQIYTHTTIASTGHTALPSLPLHLVLDDDSLWAGGNWLSSKGPVHTGPKSSVPSHSRSIRGILAVEGAWKLGLTTFTRIPKF